MTRMEREIFETPELLRAAIPAYAEALVPAAGAVRGRMLRAVVFAGRGSSDNVGIYFKYLTETHAALPVAFAAPSVVTLYGAAPDLSDKLVVAASQSGQAADVAAVLALARRQGAVTVALTNDPESPVARSSDHPLDLRMGREESVAATKTFTAELLGLGMLSALLAADRALEAALKTVPAAIERVLSQRPAIEREAIRLRDMASCFVLARGFHLAVAFELALKLQESCYVRAHAYSLPDFQHGPFALAERDALFILLAPSGKTMPDSLAMVAKLDAVGARILAFTDDATLPVSHKVVLPKVDEEIAPFVLTIASQLFACALSTVRGNDPDAPRGLKKITVTL